MFRTKISTAVALVVVVPMSGAATASVLVADYQFNNDLKSSVAGAPNLVFPGTGGGGGGNTISYTSGVTIGASTHTVANIAAASGFTLDVSAILAGYSRDYTVAILYNAPVGGGYSSLVDASNGGSDNHTYSYANRLTFYYGSDLQIGSLPANQWNQAIISVTPNGVSNFDLLGATGTGGGQAIGTVANVAGAGFAVSPANKINFFRDDGGDSFPAGSIARIQVYAGAITDTPTLNALDLSVVSAVPEPASLTILALGGLALLSRKRRCAGTSIP